MKLVRARLMAGLFASCLVAVAFVGSHCFAGFNNGGGNRVGGVAIDATGVVRTATVQENQEQFNLLRNEVVGGAGDLEKAADLRMVSLAGLQEAIVESRKSGGRLPAEIRYLAGLTGIDYVFVDKEKNDIVLAGPAEPWKLSETGSVVGKDSGKAILLLEDLIVSLRMVSQDLHSGISCSIEPTDEGRQRLNSFLQRIQLRPGQNPSIYEAGMKQAFGAQTIRLAGVDPNSRYACTLVAADYQMKRLAMSLVDSPVKGLPSYLQMARNSAHLGNQNPRWWMECNYESLTRNEEGTVWKLTGQGVKTKTEQDKISDDGSATAAGKSDKVAQAWADTMTERFESLAAQMPIFGELQNIMDMTVVSTLIVQEQLEQQSGLDLTVMRDESTVQTPEYEAPQTVSPECSFIKGRSGWVVTASGGVSVDAISVIRSQKVDAELDPSMVASSATNAWWWNSAK